jgi:hypothetical protein
MRSKRVRDGFDDRHDHSRVLVASVRLEGTGAPEGKLWVGCTITGLK